MSVVVFPFKSEDPDVAGSNLAAAANHPRVERVIAVGAGPDATFEHLHSIAPKITSDTRTPVDVTIQDRIGNRRPGKGDGMNTALRLFLETDHDRLHFYDADITNFDGEWISGAESAADKGFQIVRHYFPRSSTDAMITWMITRPGFAITHGDSVLSQIRQPLGGELLLTRPVVEELVANPMVADRSDWGIDTVITFATVATGLDIYEHFMAGGKQHALYGSLDEIRDMVIECFEAVWSLAGEPTPRHGDHVVEEETPATEAVATKVGYSVEKTIHLLMDQWSPEEISAAAHLPDHIAEPLLANVVRPTFAFVTADLWGEAYRTLLESYRAEPGWQGLVFRLWVARVLAYTTSEALSGHTRAMATLERTITAYRSI